MKEQSKASERELSEEEIHNLSDGEFKALVNFFLSKKKKIKNMNSKMTTNSQLSTNEPKRKNKQ